MVICLCGCGVTVNTPSNSNNSKNTDNKVATADIVGTWASSDRSTASQSTYTDQLGNEIVLSEAKTNDYKIVFYDDGSYLATNSYENIEYDWSSDPPRRSKKSGQNTSEGTWKIEGNSVILTDDDGTTTLTYAEGILNSPKTSNYTYKRQ